MSFVIVPSSEWRFTDRVERIRKQRLLDTPFDQILAQISDGATLVSHHWMAAYERPDLYRVVFKLKLPAEAVDLFHNGAGGYRAQYYDSIEQGERANRCAIEAMRSMIQTLLAAAKKPKCSWEAAEASLAEAGAKVWIHQSTWYRQKWITLRNLQVPRWIANGQMPPCVRDPRLPIWATLAPEFETCLEVKGGWLDADLSSRGYQLKRYRSEELHCLGYT